MNLGPDEKTDFAQGFYSYLILKNTVNQEKPAFCDVTIAGITNPYSIYYRTPIKVDINKNDGEVWNKGKINIEIEFHQ
jgi:hypothetical protein